MIVTLDATSIPMPIRDRLGETRLRTTLAPVRCYESDSQVFLDDVNSP